MPAKVARGTLWPPPHCYHLPATPENIEGLAALFANRVPNEICDHLHGYDASGMLLQWYDSFWHDPFLVSKVVPEENVRAFCQALGLQYGDAKV